MKKNILIVVLIIIIMQGYLYAKGSSSYQGTLINVAGGDIDSNYYNTSQIFVSVWNEYLRDDYMTNTLETEGSVSNLSLVKTKEATLGFANSVLVYEAQEGIGRFREGNYRELRLIAGLAPDLLQIIAISRAGISNISDLRDTTVNIGLGGSSETEVMINVIEKIAGIDRGTVELYHIDNFEGITMMKDGKLFVTSTLSSIPSPLITQINESTLDVSLLPISSGLIDDIHQKMSPYFSVQTIPGRTYDDVNQDVSTIGSKGVIFVDKDTSEEVVYLLLKTMFENLESVRDRDLSLAELTIENTLVDLPPIFLHDGAKKFYLEKGVEIPEHLLKE